MPRAPAPAPPELHRHSFLDDAVATRPQGPPPSASARTPHSPLTLPAAPAFLPGGRFPSCAGRRAVPAVRSARAALSSWVRCPSSATRERERGSEFSARHGTGPHPPFPGLQGSARAPGFAGRAGTACGRLSAARQPVRRASPHPPREACGRLGVPESHVRRPPSVPAFVVRSQAACAPLRSPWCTSPWGRSVGILETGRGLGGSRGRGSGHLC